MSGFTATLLNKFKDVKSFFDCYRELGLLVSDLKAVVPVTKGVELTFLSRAGVEKFIDKASEKGLAVQSDHAEELTVTFSPRGDGGHALINDGVLVSYLSRFGEVKQGKRLTYKDYPTVENGVRQFRLKKLKSPIPSTVSFGRAFFMIAYRGQVQTCGRCGEAGHLAKECKKVRCFKCQEIGHVVKDCESLIVCTVCGKEGHSYKVCPNSFAGRVALGHKWSEVAKEKTPEMKPATSSNEKSLRAEMPSMSKVAIKSQRKVDESELTDTQCYKAAEKIESEVVPASQPDSEDSESELVIDESETESEFSKTSQSVTETETQELENFLREIPPVELASQIDLFSSAGSKPNKESESEQSHLNPKGKRVREMSPEDSKKTRTDV